MKTYTHTQTHIGKYNGKSPTLLLFFSLSHSPPFRYLITYFLTLQLLNPIYTDTYFLISPLSSCSRAIAPIPRYVVVEDRIQVFGGDLRPVFIQEDHLGISQLVEQEIAQAALP